MSANSIYQSGVLLHPTSLPGIGGIGEIGPEAYKFIDNLSDMGQSFWQILPLGPVDKYGSPYSSSSTFAGNELMISLELLVEDGLLDLTYLNQFKENGKANFLFQDIKDYKPSILKSVSENFDSNCSIEIKNRFIQFTLDQSYWLDDYARYCSLKQVNNNKSWVDWDLDLDSQEINEKYVKIIQFLFHDQWSRLREYCKKREIRIIGDMPIYVGYDSADVYSNQCLFQLDDSGRMKYKSGCPPCEYQEEGQVWGNPLYKWEAHEESNFVWWKNRFSKLLEMVDVIRLDHFIGYHRYYRIPINESTARNGEWIKSPGDKLFSTMSTKINKDNIIAEDLGDVTSGVIRLREKYKYPGMKVLQFEFDQIPDLDNNYGSVVMYTGTHDNDTIMGWFSTLPELDSNSDILTQEKLLEFLGCTSDQVNWEIISYAMRSRSKICIFPMQDILSLDSSCRFNTPGTLLKNNWTWRMDKHIGCDDKNKLLEITVNHKRKN